MFFIAYAFKGQVHVFAGLVKLVSDSSCRTSAILKYFCPLTRGLNLGMSLPLHPFFVCVQASEGSPEPLLLDNGI